MSRTLKLDIPGPDRRVTIDDVRAYWIGIGRAEPRPSPAKLVDLLVWHAPRAEDDAGPAASQGLRNR
jgi:hypothetical protein